MPLCAVAALPATPPAWPISPFVWLSAAGSETAKFAFFDGLNGDRRYRSRVAESSPLSGTAKDDLRGPAGSLTGPRPAALAVTCEPRGSTMFSGATSAAVRASNWLSGCCSRVETRGQLANIRQIYPPEREALGVVAIGIELVDPPRLA